MHLQSIHNFRALAILIIVMGHMYAYGLMSEDAITLTIRNILTGGTALFVFISGFMFHHVFFDNFKYQKFVMAKVKNVLVPYLILSSLAIAILYAGGGGYFDTSSTEYPGGIIFSRGDSSLVTMVKYYVSGSMFNAYWYISFVMLLFGMSNFHAKYLGLDLKKQMLLLAASLIVSLFIHRPVLMTNPIHSLVYFTPLYLIGMLTSVHSQYVKEKLDGHLPILFLVVIAIAFVEYLVGHSGNYHKLALVYEGIDLMLIQKVFLCLALYVFLEKYTFNSRLVNIVSNASFAIFFMHPWLLNISGRLVQWGSGSRSAELSPVNHLGIYIFMVFVIMSVSVLLSVVIKKVFKGSKKTKYIMGY